MNITIGELVIWLIVGAFAGSIAGALVTRKKEGYGRMRNIAIGLVGAVIGGALFNLFKIDLGLAELKVTFEDLVSAFLGSLLLLLVLWILAKRKAKGGG